MHTGDRRGASPTRGRERAAITTSLVIASLCCLTLIGPVAATADRAPGAVLPVATAPISTDPAPSPEVDPGVTVDEWHCGTYLYRAVAIDDGASTELAPGDLLPSVTVTGPTGDVVSSWAGHMSNERGLFLWCRDVTGDRVADLAYELRGSGAHCCATVVAVRLGADPAEILRVGVMDGGGLTPVQLDRSPTLELVTPDFRLAEMAGSFTSTSPFPRIFAQRGGVFVDDPRTGRSLLLADRARAVAQIAGYAAPPSGPDERVLGVGLRIEAIDLLLGTPTSGISRLPVDLPTRKAILGMRRAVATRIGASSGPLHPQTIDIGFWASTYVGDRGLVLAQATSGLPVAVASLTPDVCSLTAGAGSGALMVSFRKVGTCTLRGTQAGSAYWRPVTFTDSMDVTEWELDDGTEPLP